jgi:hypothetical protein
VLCFAGLRCAYIYAEGNTGGALVVLLFVLLVWSGLSNPLARWVARLWTEAPVRNHGTLTHTHASTSCSCSCSCSLHDMPLTSRRLVVLH